MPSNTAGERATSSGEGRSAPTSSVPQGSSSAEQVKSDAAQEEAPPLVRRTSSSKPPLRHGRKPIYPDSDAEAEGLNADVDDEELETGLHPGQGENEHSSLLSGPGRNGVAGKGIGPMEKAWLNMSKLWGGDKAYSAKLIRRQKQRRTGVSTMASRRNSTSMGSSSSFAAWRQDHPIIMRTIYAILSLILLVLILIGVAVAHLFLSTLKSPSPDAQSRILDESLLLKGPDRVQLLNISDDGILVRLDARMGLDPDHALDLWLGERGKQGWWKNQERKWVEWGMGKVAAVQVDVGEVRLAELGAAWSKDLNSMPLAFSGAAANALLDPQDMLAFHLDPLVFPLPPLNRKVPDDRKKTKGSLKPPILGNHSTPAAQHNMNPVNLTVLLKPVVPAPYIMDFAQHAIKKGRAELDVKIASLRVRGLAKNEIRGVNQKRKAGFFDVPRRIDISQHKIRSPVNEKVPKLKKNDTKTDDLLKLDGYEFFEIGKDDDDNKKKEGDKDGEEDGFFASLALRALGIKAKAQAKNPLGKVLQGNVRYSLPFGVYLPVDGIAPSTSAISGQNDATSPIDDGNNSTDASVLMAAVATEPFVLTGQKEINLNLMGRVVPPPNDSKPKSSGAISSAQGQILLGSESRMQGGSYAEISAVKTLAEGDSPQQAALSNFLSRFLRGEANTVFVRGGSPFRKPADDDAASAPEEDELPGGGSDLPDWMDSALRLLDVPISFPGSKVTDLIKNVTINDLKITPHPFEKDKLLCSGTVMGEMNLPGQLSTVDVQITHLWPDILVYDGKPPSMRHGKSIEDAAADSHNRFSLLGGALETIKRFAYLSTDGDNEDDDGDDGPKKPEPEPAPPLPDPLPDKAFGRVRPYDFAPAETYIDPEDPKGERKLLRSVLKDVPFNVLPGRGPIFRAFTWKLLTGQGALVGIEGSSRAKIWNSGLGTLQLRNLPVKGAFVLGKRD